MVEPSILIILAIFLPFIAAAAINLCPRLRGAISAISGGAIIYIIYLLGERVANGELITAKVFTLIQNLPILFKVEPLGLVYATVASSLWIVTAIYSLGYLKADKDPNQKRFFIFLAISIGLSIAIAFAGNLLTMLIFYEALTFATYPLVTHKGDQKSIAGGRKYIAYLLGTSIIFLIPAIIITYSLTGNIEFTQGGVFTTALSPATLIMLLLLFAYGIGKAALMPLHNWLPAAMVAPAPVSALLHAVAVVKAGVFCLAKVLIFIFGLEMLKFANVPNIIAYLATFTIIAASVIAIIQNNIKKRLAYSTIAQLSYIILAVTLFSQAGVAAAATYITAHAVTKITLFFIAGAVIIITTRENITQFRGLGRKMPFLFICFLIASLSLIGMPGLAGGEAKHLLSAAAKNSNMPWVTYLLYLGMFLNALYLLPVSYYAFCKKPVDDQVYKTPLTIKLAIFITTLLIVTFSFYTDIILTIMGS